MEHSELLSSAPPPPGLDHPFDRFQRHRDVQLVVARMAAALGRSRLRVLDVGGAELTQQFMPEHEIIVTNLSLEHPFAVQSSGAALPFIDNAFDVVLTIDTLEHIPPADRQMFLSEMMRVANSYVLITGPFASPINHEAERLLDDYIFETTGQHYYYLAEHLEFGLPALHDTERQLIADGCATFTIPSGYTPRWIAMMLLRFSMAGTAQGRAANQWLEKLYNHQFYWIDHTEPSYRQVVIAAKDGSIEAIREIGNLFAVGKSAYGEPDFDHLLALWQTMSVARIFDAYEQKISLLQSQNEMMAANIKAFESGRFMRFMSTIHALRRHFEGV